MCQYVGATLEELEKHAEPVVPRDVVSPRLQLLFEGDLTPITLVQLMCVGDWISVRQGNEGEIRVTYDERLAQQISGFGLFMASFVESLCSQSTMLSDGSVATVFEARPATEPGICAFLEMSETALAEPEPEEALDVEREPEPEPEPEPVSEAAPTPSSKEQEKLRIAREVKAARDKMEELDKARVALLNQLLVLRHKHEQLSDQSGWRAIVEMEEVGRQVKDLSSHVDQLDEQLRDARLAYAETRAASLQALKELGQ